MKTTTKILHLLWGGHWSLYILWVALSGFSWSWASTEPFALLLPIAPAAWLVFAVGLLVDRRWAWFGSFVCTVFSLFAGVWVTMQSLYYRTSFVWELVGTLVAFTVLGFLLHTRQSFLMRHERAA